MHRSASEDLHAIIFTKTRQVSSCLSSCALGPCIGLSLLHMGHLHACMAGDLAHEL